MTLCALDAADAKVATMTERQVVTVVAEAHPTLTRRPTIDTHSLPLSFTHTHSHINTAATSSRSRHQDHAGINIKGGSGGGASQEY